MLTVLTPPQTTLLATYDQVVAALNVPYDTHHAFIEELLAYATQSIADMLDYPYARQQLQERLAGTAMTRTMLSGTPTVLVETVTMDGDAIADYEVENPGAGFLYRETGWGRSQFLARGGLGPSVFPSGSDKLQWTFTYWSGWLLPGDNRWGTTYKIDATASQLIDVSASLPLYVPGDRLRLSGFAAPGNNGFATVVERVDAGTVELSGLTLVDEDEVLTPAYSASTLSVSAMGNIITDSADSLPTFTLGSLLESSGFGTPGNNVRGTVVDSSSGLVQFDSDVIMGVEPEGLPVTLSTVMPRPQVTILCQTLPASIQWACIDVVKAWYLERQFSLTGPRVVDTGFGSRVLNAPPGQFPRSAMETLKPYMRVA